MAKVNKRSIEVIFNKVYENFDELSYYEQIELLNDLEKKANLYEGEEIDEYKVIEMAFERVKYCFARIYSEGKAKSTLVNLKKNIDFLEEVMDKENIYYLDTRFNMIKELITHLEITLNLDVSFHMSLLDIYQRCLEKDNVTFNDLKFPPQGRYKR